MHTKTMDNLYLRAFLVKSFDFLLCVCYNRNFSFSLFCQDFSCCWNIQEKKTKIVWLFLVLTQLKISQLKKNLCQFILVSFDVNNSLTLNNFRLQNKKLVGKSNIVDSEEKFLWRVTADFKSNWRQFGVFSRNSLRIQRNKRKCAGQSFWPTILMRSYI